MTFAELTWEDLKEWAGSRVVTRGKSYRSAVEDLRLTADGRLLACVGRNESDEDEERLSAYRSSSGMGTPSRRTTHGARPQTAHDRSARRIGGQAVTDPQAMTILSLFW